MHVVVQEDEEEEEEDHQGPGKYVNNQSNMNKAKQMKGPGFFSASSRVDWRNSSQKVEVVA